MALPMMDLQTPMASSRATLPKAKDDVGSPAGQKQKMMLEAQQALAKPRDEVLASCIVKPIAAALTVGRTVLSTKAASQVCPFAIGEKSLDKHIKSLTGQQKVRTATKRLCSTDVNAAITSFSSLASILSTVASSCGKTMNKQAACAADITELVASLFAMATAASSVSLLCVPELRHQNWAINHTAVPPLRRLVGNFSKGEGRRLQMQGGQGISLGSGARVTSCVFDAIGAAVAFAHFGIHAKKASRQCPEAQKLGAQVPKLRRACAQDALHMSSSLVGAGAAMSWAATLCTDINIKAGCAASVQQLTLASINIASASLSLKQACVYA